jgi:CRISPR-associated endonuclease Csn1
MATELVFGFDIGSTSIGSAVVRMDGNAETGSIIHLGVRIFPEARDPDGVPLNQERRRSRMMRRQLRRRRSRRKDLNSLLSEAALLPAFSKANGSPWTNAMAQDPWQLRADALDKALGPYELGRVLYHLAQRRHFRGRDLEELDTEFDDKKEAQSADERKAASQRETDRKTLKASGLTLGAFIASIPERAKRRRGHHFAREDVAAEFRAIIAAQSPHHSRLRDQDFVAALEQTIFDQKPVFWRKATLGACRFIPAAELAASASWVAQEKRMLEKLNNLRIDEGNGRPLDENERKAIQNLLRKQNFVSWSGIRRHLKLYWRKHDMHEQPKFNLERGGEKGLVGNRLENRLAAIIGDRWETEPELQKRMRSEIHSRLYAADYGQIGGRIVIRRETERRRERAKECERLKADFALTDEQADQIAKLSFAPGWEPFSEASLWKFLPRLQQGTVFGALLAGREEESWRIATFPSRAQPTGAWVDRLPTPGNSVEEVDRQKSVRNPTVLRVQNELRKVVNNLIAVYGKPDRIRVEVAREVGKSARERAEDLKRNRDRETKRKEAKKKLQECGIKEPSSDDIEKWLLWKESRHTCPYTGDNIGFSDLFGAAPRFEVEHIWPRWRSGDNSFANKTLCRKDINIRKTNRTPLELYAGDADTFERVLERVKSFDDRYGPGGRKARRFSEPVPEDFLARQLSDSGYAARQAVGFLKALFPDLGQAAEVRVATLSGRVTAQLRRNWCLNNILSDSGNKTRADHRHHAIDALVAALAHPDYTQRLSRWFQARDSVTPQAEPALDPPFPDVRGQAEKKVAEIVVSHRVRRKVSGPLHKDTTYGDSGPAGGTGGIAYHWFVTRKSVDTLTKPLLAEDDAWPDAHVRERVRAWVAANGGDPEKAFANGYPTVSEGGVPIRKVRIKVKKQQSLMARLKNGYADKDLIHHLAIYKTSTGKYRAEAVKLFDAAARMRDGRSSVDSKNPEFVMSLGKGDQLFITVDGKRAIWVVTGIESDGRAALSLSTDARPTEAKIALAAGFDGPKTIFRPRLGGLIRANPQKVAVDPIGRIRPARD